MGTSLAAFLRHHGRARLLATAVAVLCLAGTASARDLTDAESTMLNSAVEMYDKAMEGKDVPILVKAIPPRIIKQMAEHDKASEDDIRKALGDLIGQTLEALPVHSFTMDMAKAEHGHVADGTPYLLIPTETVMTTGGEGKTLMRTATLAMLDGDLWYMVRGSDAQQVAALREAYPEYETVVFPDATMELVKE
ncbi:hypothetical protein [Taklimakanibacter albus]|uniref:Uncharacterized protein n=1 Tax=Taklimakanibacter albus TaxID=2800327 RepID=A0ACC5R5E1_9HYPH|nr:hypothetical protein [Aestuariivirga sp. YIM B02566]MBK1867824.1 hypothetical protein [Aestuariivirga sp. YIM B02566]